MNLEKILEKIKKESSEEKRVVLCDINDERILQVCNILIHNNEKPVLVWQKTDFQIFGEFLEKNNYKINTDYFMIWEEESAITYSAQLLKDWNVDWFLWWNISSSGDIVKWLFKWVWMAENISRVSSYFIQDNEKGLFFTADCAVQPNPNAQQLAEIAFLTAQNCASYWIVPRIAMLSFSTAGSAITDETKKVQEATKLAEELLEKSDLEEYVIEWEIQLDAALREDIALKKNPDSQLKWQANVLIFPDLNSWNIGYKLIDYFADSTSLWPILQWLSKPWNDLSRWSSVDEILKMYYITKHNS